jgi:hypothetical protein
MEYSSDEDDFELLHSPPSQYEYSGLDDTPSSQDSNNIRSTSNDADRGHAAPPQGAGLVDGCLDAVLIRDKGRLRTIAFTDADADAVAMRDKIGNALTQRARRGVAPENGDNRAIDARPWQIATAAEILLGRDTLVVTATGSGKTMCFFLALLADVRASVLVISPLLALMDDQVQLIRSKRQS